MSDLTILQGDCREKLRGLPDASVHTCVTSPPYWGLRNYNVDGQIGLEKSPAEYVAQLVEVFREVHRVLRDDGTLWLNLGDSYAGSWGNYGGQNRGNGKQRKIESGSQAHQKAYDGLDNWRPPTAGNLGSGLKPKDLIGIPWRVAFALQEDGWYLRQDIIWAKPNPMPESVEDRCTKSHEYIFMLSKSSMYFYDQEAIKEPAIYADDDRIGRAQAIHKSAPDGTVNGIRARSDKQRGHSRRHAGFNDRWDQMKKSEQCSGMRNKRSVWNVSTAPYPDAHFATYPPALIKPCILAGSPAGGTVLDPFGGSGTTGKVALELGRSAVLIELNPDYVKLIEKRCRVNLPLMFDLNHQPLTTRRTMDITASTSQTDLPVEPETPADADTAEQPTVEAPLGDPEE
jgi:DNA modification methylase